ncbi:MAG: hypothetical protein ROW48_03255 [Bellilinea sp.]|jgi:hypothetical protein
MFAKRILFGLFLFLTASCAPQPMAAVTETTPPLVNIHLDPALDWLRPNIQSCSRQFSERLWDIQAKQPSADFDIQGDIFLQWRSVAPDNFEVFILGNDELMIVTHPDNPLSEIPLDVLRSVFRGDIQSWEEVDPALAANDIQLVIYPESNPIQEFFTQTVLENQGNFPAIAQLAPHPAAMLNAISQDTASIGLLPARWVDNQVKPLGISGLTEELSQPILAVVMHPPDDVSNAWLACLQTRISP